MSHLPGPWQIHENEDLGDITVGVPTGPDHAKWGSYFPVCEMLVMDDEEWEEAKANARLIASAPDLLAALSDLVGTFDRFDPKREGYAGFPVDQARKAIAKATGGQP